ncbi:hypothetical protein V8D89_004860 [Ganoderma adspersum]
MSSAACTLCNRTSALSPPSLPVTSSRTSRHPYVYCRYVIYSVSSADSSNWPSRVNPRFVQTLHELHIGSREALLISRLARFFLILWMLTVDLMGMAAALGVADVWFEKSWA